MNRFAQILKGPAVAVLIAAAISAQNAWNPGVLVRPEQAATQMQASASDKPLIVFVGFPVLYRAAHIPDAILAGPASTAEGLAKLKETASRWPRTRRILLYCGCCPFVKCPNVRPAYQALHDMGFTQLQVLELDQNFHTDWVAKGYPVKRPA